MMERYLSWREAFMDYHYESLLDERFQMLCQALLLREYSGVQCYPVGMPDGGRDATAPDANGKVVFQVKYARNPHGIADPLKWVINAINGEVEKVKKLAARGATSFVLMTNLSGTSHLDSGRMDKVQSHLDSVMPVPASCWWRDDLDRRLDVSYDLKLKYPSLLSGTDIIRILWEATGTGQDRQRRSNALAAYFADQSERDSKVRFKQADLSPSPLFDLFIDVPATPRRGPEKTSKGKLVDYRSAVISALKSRNSGEESLFFEDSMFEDVAELIELGVESGLTPGRSVGAASLILSHAFGPSVSRIVLEGAPGQGKSTFAQYIAQVHRSRILHSEAATSIPAHDATSPLMMPFKMELRDLATWLKGIDPWAPGEITEHGRPRSLESALAAHVERYSGGVNFDVSDLLFVIQGAAALVILDALDEVADLDDRQRVVDEVTAAATRLETRNPDLKLVITSRPTAVAGSPTFDNSKFYYLTLAAIRPRLAMQYTEKWAKARNLDDSDLSMLLNTLEQKLKAPHMAELAKNTMQLSILLSLTHLRGSTLPDKRTELYDAYIEVFLNREAEKDRTVRENRELLINIHRYLGYYLHARAEVDGATGRLSTEELRGVLTAFLERETASSPTMQRKVAELIDSLLTGVVERVVALVSRVEGTYEFEVQPLREYFAAKYLYETAPYAPATRSQAGTKPDRFDGIAPNPYWMNVTRFFAGCFSKGELLDLADRTARLIEDSEITEAPYPRTLALCLLQDWVFTQSASSMKRILEAVFDRNGIRWASSKELSSRSAGYGAGVSVELSPSAGYENLVDRLWPMLTSSIPAESLSAVCLILQRQPENSLLSDLWYKEAIEKTPQDLVGWCAIGNSLGVFKNLDFGRFRGILQTMDATGAEWGLAAYVQGGGEIARLSPVERHNVIKAILNGVGARKFTVVVAGNESAVLRVTEPTVYAYMMRSPEYLLHLLNGMLQGSVSEMSEDYQPLVKHASGLTKDRNLDFAFWRNFLEEMRAAFGKTWRECSLANLAVSTKDPAERGVGSRSLFDDSRPLLDRLRNARRRPRQTAWWEAQYEQANDPIDRGLWVLAVFSWVHPESLADLSRTFNRAVRDLDDAIYASVLDSCYTSRTCGKYSRASISLDGASLADLNWRTLALLYDRLSQPSRRSVLMSFLRSRSRDDLAGAVFMDRLVSESISGEFDLEENLRSVCSTVRRGITAGADLGYREGSMERLRGVRSQIIKNSWELPSGLVSAAHSVSDTRRRFNPVMEIAEQNNWFDE
ncbi:NACHT domain-containing NTPase [Streptomyces sp. ISL-11]|uniref:NACHT domain-containing protein n=1 Tax=Streptomyces sp. ISL-11 TaxID=2819174 RepID=UPI001BEC64A8|nr:NACHT domain-containing protein [Streptomyces sp. ISL-11]MBT2383089.1 NACHT domain-containing protein [Streptomyces sp. ISL-11]